MSGHLYRDVAVGAGTKFSIREAEFRTGVAYALDCLYRSGKASPNIRYSLINVAEYLINDCPTGDDKIDYHLMDYFLRSWEDTDNG